VLSPTDVEFLRQVSVFAALPDDALRGLAVHARRQELAPGGVLFEEGQLAKEMVVVLDGQLEVVKRGRCGRDARLAVVGRGDIVGEMSIIDIQPRSAAVRAVTATSVAVIGHVDFANVYRDDPQSYTLMVMNIAREISLRLRRMDAMLANIMTEIDEVTTTDARGVGARPA
jgi:CRP-like cAMP-binding protein